MVQDSTISNHHYGTLLWRSFCSFGFPSCSIIFPLRATGDPFLGDRLLAQARTEPTIRSWIGPFTEHRRPTFPEGQVAPLVATQSGTPQGFLRVRETRGSARRCCSRARPLGSWRWTPFCRVWGPDTTGLTGPTCGKSWDGGPGRGVRCALCRWFEGGVQVVGPLLKNVLSSWVLS